MVETGLMEVPRTKRHYRMHQSWGFGEGDVREALERVFSPNRKVVLFRTIANQEAVEELKQYYGHREKMSDPWEIKKYEGHDNTIYSTQEVGNRLAMDNNLMDAYQRAIKTIAEREIGKRNYADFPMVKTDGVHNMERDPKAIFWPRVYMVWQRKEKELKEVIDNLCRDEAFEVLKEQESPQFYQMGEIEVLHELKIKPILRLEDELRLPAKELTQYVDFLVQMRETYKWTGPVIFDD